jgi:hypothetical protein
VVSAGKTLAAAGIVGFGVVAWWPVWPIDLPTYGFLDGLVLVVLGTAAIAIPGIPAWLAVRTGSHRRPWLGIGLALALAALYVGYFWGTLMLYFRDPENTFWW